ncbi:MAG: histidinol dehydrogenase [Desulfovibrio sp.]|jgi:histidinol dehydrogenase|nr:histidinol dehydrogenase [Desulfovibrio sp.]
MTCRILTLRNEQEWHGASQWLKGRCAPDESVENTVRGMLAAVRVNGDKALVSYTRRFDCPDFAPPLRVSEQDIARAAAQVSVEHREHISGAAANIRAFHEAQMERSWFMTRPDGSILGQKVTPVDAAGLYVPGGQGGNTPLISTLLMNAIPAQAAGVPRIAVCTPPRQDGSINPHILAAAHLLGIGEVYRVGGAWAIAAMTFGTESLPPVDIIAGPGNIWVTTAKRLCQGIVGIDMIAGPSEVLILADSSANPVFVAADMLSQAEHDPLASALCITDDDRLAETLQQELQKQCATLPRARTAARALRDWSAIVVTSDMNAAVAIANLVAPEHLEICTRDPWALLPRIRHAGTVFLGQHSPEAVGDYYAGPNHVLPTMGTARFASALSVQTFCKKTSIVAVSPSFVREHVTAIADLARLEGLEAHARSVEARLPQEKAVAAHGG